VTDIGFLDVQGSVR